MAKRLRRTAPLISGLAILTALVLVSVTGPLWVDVDPLQTDPTAIAMRPGSDGHLLGTDSLGRDTLARVLIGGRSSLLIGVMAGALSLALGLAVGALAAMGPRWVDGLLSRLMDVLLALPLFVIMMAMASIASDGILTVILVIGVLGWVVIARIVRARFLVLREQDFVLAAEALGSSRVRIAILHILPNAVVPVLAVASFEVAGAILAEASLSYLGLGVSPQTPTWGNVLANGQQQLILGQWWTVLFPGAAITLTVIAVNLVAGHFRTT